MEQLPDIIIKKDVLFEPFPKQQEFLDAAISGLFDFILFGGAVRGGKTYAMLAFFIFMSRIFPGSRWVLIRKDLPTIKRNLYPSWDKIKPTNFIARDPSDSNGQTCTFKNGSVIIFFPESYSTDKDQDRWKGLEANGFGFEEINECQEVSLDKAFERAGTYIIKGLDVQPKPIVLATCNPTQGWVKKRFHTPWKNKLLGERLKYIQSRIFDNIPLLTAQPDLLPSMQRNMKKYEYMVYVDGNWDVQLKTGNEFLRKFEISKHVKPLWLEGDLPVFVSIDNNVYPFISISVWQLIKREDGGWKIRQVDELIAEDPENTASQAAAKTVRWLQAVEYNLALSICGDKSTKSLNTIDPQKRSFFQIFQQTIGEANYKTIDKMLGFAPPVSSIGDFVNAILDGEIPELEIEINEICVTSINDYIETKTDKDGSILKVRVAHPTVAGLTYEKNGHLVDTLKDLIVDCFYPEFYAWVNKKNQLIPGGVKKVPRIPNITY